MIHRCLKCYRSCQNCTAGLHGFAVRRLTMPSESISFMQVSFNGSEKMIQITKELDTRTGYWGGETKLKSTNLNILVLPTTETSWKIQYLFLIRQTEISRDSNLKSLPTSFLTFGLRSSAASWLIKQYCSRNIFGHR